LTSNFGFPHNHRLDSRRDGKEMAGHSRIAQNAKNLADVPWICVQYFTENSDDVSKRCAHIGCIRIHFAPVAGRHHHDSVQADERVAKRFAERSYALLRPNQKILRCIKKVSAHKN